MARRRYSQPASDWMREYLTGRGWVFRESVMEAGQAAGYGTSSLIKARSTLSIRAKGKPALWMLAPDQAPDPASMSLLADPRIRAANRVIESLARAKRRGGRVDGSAVLSLVAAPAISQLPDDVIEARHPELSSLLARWAELLGAA